ncbi:MAG: TauD/TfdA family dioxygenase [Bdellovibrionaceae bacterium]|nr:TauD/TfdA family dioxygenase [Pseudobdellovibrionaceae bacterium]
MILDAFEGFGAFHISEDMNYKNLPVHDLLKVLRQKGILIFRGFNIHEVRDFENLTRMFSSDFLKHGVSHREKISADGETVGVVKGENFISLHCEMGYSPIRPEALWLYCRKPAMLGGQTTLCNAGQYWSFLSDSTKSLFEKYQISYHHRWPEQVWKSFFKVQDITEIEKLFLLRADVKISKFENGILEFVFTTWAMQELKNGQKMFMNSILNMIDTKNLDLCQVTWSNGSSLGNELVDELRRIGDFLTRNFDWCTNDVICVDNKQVLHGRRAFQGPREVMTRFSSKLIEV